MRVLLVLLVVAAAGCASPAIPASPAAPPAAHAATLPWILTSCREISAYWNADASKVEPLLPPGFHVTSGRGGLRLPPGNADMGMNAFRCAGDVSEGAFWVQVAPPAELKDPKSCCDFVKWNAVITNASERAALAAANASVNEGRAAFAETSHDGGTITVTLEIKGVGLVTLNGVTHPPVIQQGNPRFREFSPTGAKPVVWAATAAYGDTIVGEGTIMVPPGSLPATIYGDTRIPATFTVSDLSLKDGTIDLS